MTQDITDADTELAGLDTDRQVQTIWQDIDVHLPANWEMVRFGLHYARGACTFADEFGERLQLSWQRDVDRPDMDRVVSDLRAQASLEQGQAGADTGGAHFESLPASSPWRGLVTFDDGQATTRAVNYFAGNRTLLETTVFWRDDRSQARERKLLEDIHPVPPAALREWRAFGISATIPANLPLVTCRCLPGKIELAFKGPKSLPSLTIRRLAFVSAWLKGTQGEWLRKSIPAQLRIRGKRTYTSGPGHPIDVVTTRCGDVLSRLGLRRSVRTDYAVVCPEEQRMYHVTEENRAGAPRMLTLRCECGELLAPAKCD